MLVVVGVAFFRYEKYRVRRRVCCDREEHGQPIRGTAPELSTARIEPRDARPCDAEELSHDARKSPCVRPAPKARDRCPQAETRPEREHGQERPTVGAREPTPGECHHESYSSEVPATPVAHYEANAPTFWVLMVVFAQQDTSAPPVALHAMVLFP